MQPQPQIQAVTRKSLYRKADQGVGHGERMPFPHRPTITQIYAMFLADHVSFHQEKLYNTLRSSDTTAKQRKQATASSRTRHRARSGVVSQIVVETTLTPDEAALQRLQLAPSARNAGLRRRSTHQPPTSARSAAASRSVATRTRRVDVVSHHQLTALRSTRTRLPSHAREVGVRGRTRRDRTRPTQPHRYGQPPHRRPLLHHRHSMSVQRMHTLSKLSTELLTT